jgi:hypothetical protein
MKTDELIKMLSTNLEPVSVNELRNTLLIALAIAVSVVAATCLGWSWLNVPTNMGDGPHWDFMAIALILTSGFAAAGAHMLFRSGRPGHSRHGPLLLLGLLLLVVLGARVAFLNALNHSMWSSMMDTESWGTCLICIPIFAVIPFGALIWGLRKAAPTPLVLTGAITSSVAGALGATAVVIHQAGPSAVLIAFWYCGPIALCALVGATIGPRLLRW